MAQDIAGGDSTGTKVIDGKQLSEVTVSARQSGRVKTSGLGNTEFISSKELLRAACCNLSEEALCPICKNDARDQSVICVVETPRDATAVENTHEFKGVYHVLHGAISPLNDVGPENLTIKQLLARFSGNDISEVIMATNPTVEGDATALYISKLLKPMGVRVTRLAYGIPVGGDLEYADEYTLAKALEGRNEI